MPLSLSAPLHHGMLFFVVQFFFLIAVRVGFSWEEENFHCCHITSFLGSFDKEM